MNKYEVKVYIRGGISRPPYNPTVKVWAENDEEAAEKAVKELRRGTFQDVWGDAFKVQEVKRVYS